MAETSLKRRSRRLYDVAERVKSVEVAALLRRYAAELAVEAKARSRERRFGRLVRAGHQFGLIV